MEPAGPCPLLAEMSNPWMMADELDSLALGHYYQVRKELFTGCDVIRDQFSHPLCMGAYQFNSDTKAKGEEEVIYARSSIDYDMAFLSRETLVRQSV
ncbi:hypothetical protein EYF80_001650 [Liparis tanakae]|uniref:Uncharacterized protein n=1 Tax=Liparis tanakae TaxID=230148 RepID=A0A4Z2JCX9_9TELE|nr:hypothetical protein EYF80_001650 [Liparis tanakae]